MLAALRLVFNATALLALLALATALGIASFHAQALPWEPLVLGRLLAEAGSIPKAEGLLFTAAPGTPFDARSWAWDWAAFQIYHLAPSSGEDALRWADGLAWILATWALATAAFRRGARPFSTAAFTAWALLAARPDLAPGPGLFGFAAFCGALWIMEGEFWPALFGRWIWLGPLAVVAVNATPAAWSLAPLVLLWMAFGRGNVQAPPQPRLAKSVFAVAVLVCLCLHPQGLSGLWSAATPWLGSPLQPGAFAARQGALLLMAVAFLLLVASSWTQAGRPRLGRDAALLLAFAAAALLNRGALPFFLALAAPAAAARFDALVDALPSALRSLRWPAKVAVLAGLAGWIGSGALRVPPSADAAASRPQQTLAFYRGELLNTDVLCPPAWTPFLAWKLSPDARFALDERGVAEASRAADLKAALDAQGDYAAALTREQVGLCWLARESPLSVALASSQSWQPVSFDDASVVYVPSTPANAELIRTRAPRGLRPGDPVQPFDPTRLAQAEADLEADLARDPGMGVLYLYMSQLWMARGHEPKARETLEAGIRADPVFAPNYARLAALRAATAAPLDVDAARTLYRRALELEDRDAWRQSLAALGPA